MSPSCSILSATRSAYVNNSYRTRKPFEGKTFAVIAVDYATAKVSWFFKVKQIANEKRLPDTEVLLSERNEARGAETKHTVPRMVIKLATKHIIFNFIGAEDRQKLTAKIFWRTVHNRKTSPLKWFGIYGG